MSSSAQIFINLHYFNFKDSFVLTTDTKFKKTKYFCYNVSDFSQFLYFRISFYAICFRLQFRTWNLLYASNNIYFRIVLYNALYMRIYITYVVMNRKQKSFKF